MDSNSKIMSYVRMGIAAVLIVVSGFLAYRVASLGEPSKITSDEDLVRLGNEVVERDNLKEDKSIQFNGKEISNLNQEELDAYIKEVGTTERNELAAVEDARSKTFIMFSYVLVIIGGVLVALGVVFAIILAPKKFIVGIISLIGFVLLLFIIYKMSGNTVPDEYTQLEKDKIALNPNYEVAFTADNWKMATAAIWSMVVLVGIALVSIVASNVVRIIK